MRPADPDDLKFLYAAWRLGSLNGFEGLALPDDMTPAVFAEAIAQYVDRRAHLGFTLIAKPPKRDPMPVGIVFGIVPIYGKNIMIFGNFTWFPWASPRNKLEATVHFLNTMRREWSMLGFADADAEFFEHVCKYGVMRRLGTAHDMFGAKPTPVFQTRKPYWGTK